MDTSEIAFEFVSAGHGTRHTSCSACGATVEDFTGSQYSDPPYVDADGLYPNQAKHAAFHARVGF